MRRSLRTAVNLMLNSRHAMWIGWGAQATFLYSRSEAAGFCAHLVKPVAGAEVAALIDALTGRDAAFAQAAGARPAYQSPRVTWYTATLRSYQVSSAL